MGGGPGGNGNSEPQQPEGATKLSLTPASLLTMEASPGRHSGGPLVLFPEALAAGRAAEGDPNVSWASANESEAQGRTQAGTVWGCQPWAQGLLFRSEARLWPQHRPSLVARSSPELPESSGSMEALEAEGLGSHSSKGGPWWQKAPDTVHTCVPEAITGNPVVLGKGSWILRLLLISTLKILSGPP